MQKLRCLDWLGKLAGSVAGGMAVLLLTQLLGVDWRLAILFIPAFLLGSFIEAQVDYWVLSEFLNTTRRERYKDGQL